MPSVASTRGSMERADGSEEDEEVQLSMQLGADKDIEASWLADRVATAGGAVAKHAEARTRCPFASLSPLLQL